MRRRLSATAALTAATLTAAGLLAPAPALALTLYSASDVQRAMQVYDAMSTAQRVGQLFMVGVPVTGLSSSERSLLQEYGVGNVILMGGTTQGAAAVGAVVRAASVPTTSHPGSWTVLPWISVDQEGGEVQHLQGPGFDRMPTALSQGRLAPSTLEADAKTWGSQLRRAGVRLDLAPVTDVVPQSVGTSNQPIGRYYREYGYTPSVVSAHIPYVIAGMAQAGVATSSKHFPGLGRATGNTDTASSVTDPTTRHDAYLAPFQRAVNAAVPFVMVSMATYPAIDRTQVAAFSSTIVTSMLRGDLGFRGVIVSDTLQAKTVSSISYGLRATRFVGAGGDLLLITDTSPLAAMARAIEARMASNSAFAAEVKAAVLQLLESKAHNSMLGS